MDNSSHGGKTAILVIHGIGEQNPFETLDHVTQGIVDCLRAHHKNVSARHCLSKRAGADGKEWMESFVRLERAEASDIDIHEFYWAHMTEEQITYDEVLGWLNKTLRGAKTAYAMYKERFGLQRRAYHNYWWRLNSMIVRLRLFLWIARFMGLIADALESTVPWIGWAKKLARIMRSLATPVVVGYLGDIAIYTTMDQKSKHFRLRQHIIAEATALLTSLCDEQDRDRHCAMYDQIIILGHSLGSVVAYDVLNRLHVARKPEEPPAVNLERVQGLVTFGSPLDKVAFFFREHVDGEQIIRRQILDQLHSFRSRWNDNDPGREHYDIELVFEPHTVLKPVIWMNMYDRKDPISGCLEFYTVDKNIEMHLGARWGVAHNSYWGNSEFYNHIVKQFKLV